MEMKEPIYWSENTNDWLENREYYSSRDIRKLFVDFYLKKLHKQIQSVPLLPENDSTLLFVNSGMFPLVPYLLWEKHPQWNKLVNFQRSFRADDMNDIWDNRHTTMFEMLWNWSLWEYFKEEQLNNWYEFLVEELKINPTRIYQTVYWWNGVIEEDEESIDILKSIYKKYWVDTKVWPKTTWKWELWPGVEIDFNETKIFPYVDKNWWQRWDNIWELWWPDSETFYDTWKKHNKKFWEHCHPNCDCGRFIEIWNSVFMQYIKTEKWWDRLKNKNVDFWWWLERLTMVCKWEKNIYNTDLFKYIIDHIEWVSDKKYAENEKKYEIIADHSRATLFLLMDWLIPSNKDQWYYIRKLVRRILMQFEFLDVDFNEFTSIIEKIITNMEDIYPELGNNKGKILDILTNEIKNFGNTLNKWFKILDEKLKKIDNNIIDGETIFNLNATYWMPFDLIKDYASENGYEIDEKSYLEKIEEHKKASRQSLTKKFKSWLADSSEITTKYHTITHLLHKALKNILWDSVNQKWSNITSERLRFDFSHNSKLTKDQIEQLENIINQWINDKFYVEKEENFKKDAIESWAIWLFDSKYEEKVNVYSMFNMNSELISKEICNGPHVENSDNIWEFKIIKEETVASWIRRIKAVLIQSK